ncbi:MAG: thioredoxin domain-containing protein [Myxococcales bacterium]|nr:thioredoxin domain-containing protein [Myxococcales bacterium]
MRAQTSPRAIALALTTLAAVGAGTSLLLLHQYLWPEAGACGPGGGCELVRSSSYARPLGIPMPALGLLFFGAFLAVLLVPRLRSRGRLALLGAIGGLTAVGLVGLQGLVIGAWCPYCVVVDTCALGLVVAAFVPALATPEARPRGPTTAGVIAMGIALPVAIGASLRPEPPPPTEASEAVAVATRAQDGKTTIVEFVDFQCPYCRRQYATMERLLAEYGDRVELRLHHWPLDRIHPQAREAARVACCAEEQGVGEAVADALMRADDLSPQGCRQAARDGGADHERLEECLGSSRPDDRLAADEARVKEYGVRALPTCFIGHQRFEGLQEEATLRAAIDQALEQGSEPT